MERKTRKGERDEHWHQKTPAVLPRTTPLRFRADDVSSNVRGAVVRDEAFEERPLLLLHDLRERDSVEVLAHHLSRRLACTHGASRALIGILAWLVCIDVRGEGLACSVQEVLARADRARRALIELLVARRSSTEREQRQADLLVAAEQSREADCRPSARLSGPCAADAL